MKEQNQPEIEEEVLVRIASKDIDGRKNVLTGLTNIKGINWAISKAICKILKIDSHKKIKSLTKDEIQKIEGFLKNPELPEFLKNRKNDRETGKSMHLYGTDLEIKKDFDIRRLKKIRSYKGIRHIHNLPVRGQRTRSNFRKKGQAVRVRKKK